MNANLAKPAMATPASLSTPKVLVLVTRDQRRGAESFGAVLADELEARGFNVRLRCLAPTHETREPIVLPLGSRPLSFATLRRLRQEILLSDVVLACGSKTLPASVIARMRTHPPIIYQNIGDPLYWAGTLLKRLRVRLLLRKVAAVAALSERSAEVLASHFDVEDDKLSVIRNARSGSTFRPPSTTERAAARVEFGVSADETLVAVIGALSSEKRIDTAISAIGHIDRSGTVLAIAGDGPMRDQLRTLADQAAPGRVRFLGTVKAVNRLMWACDLVLLTSESEGVPGVLIEAGLTGLPVVATDVGYVRDVVVPRQTGHLVASGDVDATAHAIDVALSEGVNLGLNARAHCESRFELSGVCDQWAALIRRVLVQGDFGVQE